MAGHGLSKSRITAWRQCPKRLWLQIYRKELLEESDQVIRAYQVGNEIGEIAQKLCPKGILIEDDDNLSAAIAATKSALATYSDRPIYEATFQHEGLLIRADVLLPTKNGYRMTEVKSSTTVKPYHVEDCAVQAWVLKQNKIKLKSVELAHIDTSFVYRGDGNYHGLLQSVRLDGEIKPLLDQVQKWVKGEGPVFAYHAPFERKCIAELAQRFPDLAAALLGINERVVDLLPMARKHYYHPAMKGSWSLKAVLPTIAPDLRYDLMEVGNGGDAQNAYREIVDQATKKKRRQVLIQGLREYCTLDTLALVRLAWFFEGRKFNKGGKYAA